VSRVHDRGYLRDVTLPALAEGRRAAGLSMDDYEISGVPFVVTGTSLLTRLHLNLKAPLRKDVELSIAGELRRTRGVPDTLRRTSS
jgi:hypothetical protein